MYANQQDYNNQHLRGFVMNGLGAYSVPVNQTQWTPRRSMGQAAQTTEQVPTMPAPTGAATGAAWLPWAILATIGAVAYSMSQKKEFVY